MESINLPVNKLKPYQLKAWHKLLEPFKIAVLVWPVNTPKAELGLGLLIAKAVQEPGEYFYSTHSPVEILEHIPPSLVLKKKPLTLYNGSVINDSPGPGSGVFIDYQYQERYSEQMDWALYIGSPAGMGNHFYELTLEADYLQVLTCKDTHQEPDPNLSDLRVQQDYFGNFAAGNQLKASRLSPEDIHAMAQMQFQIAVQAGEKWAIEAAMGDVQAAPQEDWELKVIHVDTKDKTL